jgi:hypothetical protein
MANVDEDMRDVMHEELRELTFQKLQAQQTISAVPQRVASPLFVAPFNMVYSGDQDWAAHEKRARLHMLTYNIPANKWVGLLLLSLDATTTRYLSQRAHPHDPQDLTWEEINNLLMQTDSSTAFNTRPDNSNAHQPGHNKFKGTEVSRWKSSGNPPSPPADACCNQPTAPWASYICCIITSQHTCALCAYTCCTITSQHTRALCAYTCCTTSQLTCTFYAHSCCICHQPACAPSTSYICCIT